MLHALSPARSFVAAACFATFTTFATTALAQSLPQPAPEFSVRTFDGKMLRLQELKGHPVVVDFWATWCVPCKASMPHLNDVQKRYGKQGLVVVGLSVDEDGPEIVRPFARELGIAFRLGMADEKVLDLYGPIRSIPTTFFIDRKGQIVRRVKGYIDGETMDAYVRELL